MTRDEWRQAIRAEIRNADGPGDARLWAPELDAVSAERLREIQSRKLATGVRWMHGRSALFRSKCDAIGLEPGDVRSVDDLSKLPITRKEEMSADLEANPPYGTFQSLTDSEWLAHGWQVFQTSGTTGTPRAFRYSQFDRELWTWNNARALYAMGIRGGKDVVLLCFGYGPHVFMWGMHYGLNLMSVPIVPGGVDSNTRAHMIDRYGVTVLFATPSYLLYLADVMRQQGLDPAASAVTRVVTGGEPVPMTTQERIAAAWGAEVHQCYGCTEAAPSCGGYTCGAGDWLHFNAETRGVESELDQLWVLNRARRRAFYRYQVEGPHALELLENLNGGPLPEIGFFRSDWLTIAGCRVRAMRHSMGGVPGLELSGRWDDRDAVSSALVEAGEAFGLRRIGSLAYFSTVVESGWWAVPVSAVHTSPELRPYREWLTTRSAVARMSLGGSFYSPRIEDWYATPWDLGYGHLVKLDHDFVGREALEAMAGKPHRRKVTLVWNADDVLGLLGRLLEDGPLAMHLDLPLAATARMHYDRVLGTGDTAGVATYPTYSVNERAMLSLASLDEAYAEPGTEVTLVWGEENSGRRSAPWIEEHEQVEIRATVAPAPISEAARKYRSAVSR